jgi:hypothetical protein
MIDGPATTVVDYIKYLAIFTMQPILPLRSKVSTKTVRTTDIIPETFIRPPSGSSGKICLVCAVNKSSYCCPRCYVPYCSASCFSRHNVQCTENFSKQRVKDVLDAEKKEKDAELHEGYSLTPSAKIFSYRDSFSARYARCGLDIPDEDIAENPQEGGEELPHSESETIDLNEDFELKSIPSRLLNRYIHLWTPWWTDDTDNTSGRSHLHPCSNPTGDTVSISAADSSLRSRLIDVKVHITDSISEIRLTAPRLNTLVKTDKISDDFGYQLIGMVLSYVITMRTMNGDWKQHPEDALALLVSSTAVLDKRFQPRCIMELVEDWVRFQPPTVQKMSRNTIRALLTDVLSVIRYWEFISFALLECWMIAMRSLGTKPVNTVECKGMAEVSGTGIRSSSNGSRSTDSGSSGVTVTSQQGERRKTVLPNTACDEEGEQDSDKEEDINSIEDVRGSISSLCLVDVNAVLTAMDCYSVDVFMKPNKQSQLQSQLQSKTTAKSKMQFQSSHKSKSSSAISATEKETVLTANLLAQKEETVLTANLLARKAFFMLLYSFEKCNLDRLISLSAELNEYIAVYCAD